MGLNKLNTKKQSENAYQQHCEIWRKHAKAHAIMAPFKPMSDFSNIGVGKALVIVANGASFELQLETLRKYQEGHDIMCCDKTLGHLIENGIKPTYCLVADAKVDYEKYMKPWEDQLDQTTLFINVCANTQWSFNGNWKDKYFFVNFDVIRSEVEFMQLSGCRNKIPAATNVSNAMLVFVTQSDNTARRNYFGYDKIMLLGFDYSWMPEGNYYSFDKNAKGKHNYMRHIYASNRHGDMVFTSANLLFSAQWLENYLHIFKLPVVNCSPQGILGKVQARPLADQMPYKYKPEHKTIVKSDIKRREVLLKELGVIDNRLRKIGDQHWQNFVQTTL